MSDDLLIASRRVYSFMEYLGDAGGTYASVYLIGQALHYILCGNQ